MPQRISLILDYILHMTYNFSCMWSSCVLLPLMTALCQRPLEKMILPPECGFLDLQSTLLVNIEGSLSTSGKGSITLSSSIAWTARTLIKKGETLFFSGKILFSYLMGKGLFSQAYCMQEKIIQQSDHQRTWMVTYNVHWKYKILEVNELQDETNMQNRSFSVQDATHLSTCCLILFLSWFLFRWGLQVWFAKWLDTKLSTRCLKFWYAGYRT